MSAPEIDIKNLLVAQGLGSFASSSDWATSIGGLQDKPDKAISLTPYSGPDAEAKVNIDYPRLQILVRGDAGETGYEAARGKAIAIKNLLHALAPIAGETFGATIIGDVAMLHRDENRRPVFVMNYQLYHQPTTAGNRIAL